MHFNKPNSLDNKEIEIAEEDAVSISNEIIEIELTEVNKTKLYE